MRVLVNGRPAPRFTPKQEAAIWLGKGKPPADGRVLTSDESTRRIRKTIRVLAVTLSVLCALLIGGLAVFAIVTDDRTIPKVPTLAGAALAGLACYGFIRFFIARSLKLWNARLAERGPLLPPAGARVRSDAAGLTIGEQLYAWRELGVETLGVREIKDSEGPSRTIVEYLELASPGGKLALDAAMIENGQKILDLAFRALRRA